MKRLAAISFLLIVLFNFYGYRLVISCMQVNSDAAIEKQVDQNNYDEERLISIKHKLDLPYYTSSPEYQRAYGSVVLNGIHYEYVKRRVYNDTLELLCLPNDDKTKMQSVSNELTKALADSQASTPKKNTTIKLTLPDFFQSFKAFSLGSVYMEKQKSGEGNCPLTNDGHRSRYKKPPRSSRSFSC